jgi:nucleoid DNA-binding protein
MTENKTKATDASISDYIASRAQAQQGNDCHALMALLEQLTGQSAKMWRPSIVGYGSYSYTYDSGRSGEAPLTGFAIRGRDLVLYLSVDSEEQQALLTRLGKHKMGKSCLYFKLLADLDSSVLEQLIAGSINELRQRYG